jgi:hypothetical protein
LHLLKSQFIGTVPINLIKVLSLVSDSPNLHFSFQVQFTSLKIRFVLTVSQIDTHFYFAEMIPLSIQEVRSTTVDYDIDPDGNTILVLVHPQTNSAEQYGADSAATDPYSTGSMVAHCGQSYKSDENEEARELPSNTLSGNNEKAEAASVLYRVQIQQLCRVSSHFKSLVMGPWFENAHFQREGGIKLYLWEEKWDPVALLILLRIMRHQLSDIPEIIDLNLLGKIVVIAEYFKCLDFLSGFLRLWGLDALIQYRRNIAFGIDNDTVVRDGVLCTFISWKLRLRGEFRMATKFLVLWAQCPINSPESSIDECIIGWFSILLFRNSFKITYLSSLFRSPKH